VRKDRGVPRRRPPAGLTHRLLAVVLLLQAVLAPALCLARGAGPEASGPAVEICTADGIGTLHGGADAPEGDDAPGEAGHRGFCPACHALPQAAAPPAPPVLPPPAWAPAAHGWLPATPAALPPGIRGPPAGARAPPALLS
jgi:hypothetical protein